MARWLVLAFTLVLLAATAVAFGRIESLKLEKDPVTGPLISPVFSPTCNCSQRVARIKFRLVKTGGLTLTVISGNHVVRTLVHGKRFRANWLHFTWNGRDDQGKVVPDGHYKFRVLLHGQHRNIVLPAGTIVDTVRPTVKLVSVTPATISPDGDHRNDRMAIRYEVDEHAKLRVLVNGRLAVKGRCCAPSGTLYWPGTVDGRVLPAGTYRVTLVAQDLAGNLSAPTKPVPVAIRFIAVRKKVQHAKQGTRFGVYVESDARSVRWKFLGRAGTTKPGLLVLKATKAGRHPVTLTANGHSARAVVVVTPRKH